LGDGCVGEVHEGIGRLEYMIFDQRRMKETRGKRDSGIKEKNDSGKKGQKEKGGK
jgi:hypothetical protein